MLAGILKGPVISARFGSGGNRGSDGRSSNEGAVVEFGIVGKLGTVREELGKSGIAGIAGSVGRLGIAGNGIIPGTPGSVGSEGVVIGIGLDR